MVGKQPGISGQRRAVYDRWCLHLIEMGVRLSNLALADSWSRIQWKGDWPTHTTTLTRILLIRPGRMGPFGVRDRAAGPQETFQLGASSSVRS